MKRPFLCTLKNMARRMIEAGRSVEEVTTLIGGPYKDKVRRWAEEAAKAEELKTARPAREVTQ